MAYNNPAASIALFTGSAAKTVANTTAETSAIPATGTGSMTLPAGFWIVGKTIRLKGGGVYGTAAVPGVLTVRAKNGSVTVASSTLGSLIGSMASMGFDFELTITCRSVGASGTLVCTGLVSYGTSGTSRANVDINTGTSTATIDTTASALLDVTVQWASAQVSNSLTTVVSTVEVVN